MSFKHQDFSGDHSPEKIVTGLVVGIVDDCLASVDSHVEGLSKDNAFGITMSAVDHFATTVIAHYADDWGMIEKMVTQHCQNILKRLLDAKREEEDE